MELLATLYRNLTKLKKLILGELTFEDSNSVTVDKVLDEDDLSSNDALALPTQQSVKAYVDSKMPTVNSSGEMTVTSGDTSYTNTHGLGQVPDDFHAFLICKTADLNYDVGDKVKVNSEHEGSYGLQLYADATQVHVIQDQGIELNNGTTRTWITYANWKIELIAIKYNHT
jgi:hypothetical protein